MSRENRGPIGELGTVQVDDSVMIRRSARGVVWDPAVVIKAGPVWITVKPERARWGEEKYRRDDRSNGSGFSQHGLIYTMTEYEEHQRQAEAWKYLHEQGIDIKLNSTWQQRVPELAALILQANEGN